MYYVTMKDTFMSGWGKSAGRDNVLVFECENRAEADIVADNAGDRSDQTNVKIVRAVDFKEPADAFVQYKTRENYPNWYRAGAFAN